MSASTSSTSPQYLHILPSSTLPFTYIPKRYLTSSIKLTNPTNLPIAYKIRTNAPFNYLVKPRQGLILPQHSAVIDITMQPSDIDPEKTSLSDKFLINACPIQDGQADINRVFLKANQELVQTDKLKVGFKVENTETLESCVETRDTSMCENSPIKEVKDKEMKEISRQGSEISELNESFCGPLEPLEETIKSNLKMTKRFASEMEIQPRKKLELNEKVNSEKVLVGEKRREEQVENKIWIEKIMEQRDKLKKHLEEIKTLNYVGEKVQKLTQGWNVKGDYKWQIFVVVMIFLLIGTIFKI